MDKFNFEQELYLCADTEARAIREDFYDKNFLCEYTLDIKDEIAKVLVQFYLKMDKLKCQMQDH